MSLDVYLRKVQPCDVYEANITHNLTEMAKEAGLYEALWRPEELKVTWAHQLKPFLKKGLKRLKQEPERFKKFNPKNGWGSYDNLVSFVEKYLEACKENPDSYIEISR